VFHSVFWNIIQVTSCDDMMINRITAVGPFEGGTTKAVTRRGLVRSGLCSFLCTPGLVVTARLPLVRGLAAPAQGQYSASYLATMRSPVR
jgi:hypothetical protein